jgi:hypothetical protein
MGYEDSTACKVLATHCCCCGKPLVDAVSIQRGVGPVCAKKYGYDLDVPAHVRDRANQIIYRLALDVSQDAVTLESLKLAEELAELGFDKIAHIFSTKLGAGVVIELREDDETGESRYFVKTPFSKAFNAASWTPGRKGMKIPVEGKKKPEWWWTFPTTKPARRALFKALLETFPGLLALGPEGAFEIAHPSKAAG